MKVEQLKQFEGKHVTITTRGLPRPNGGKLEMVGEDFVILNPNSTKIDRFVIYNNEIISIMVFKNQSIEGVEDEGQRRK